MICEYECLWFYNEKHNLLCSARDFCQFIVYLLHTFNRLTRSLEIATIQILLESWIYSLKQLILNCGNKLSRLIRKVIGCLEFKFIFLYPNSLSFDETFRVSSIRWYQSCDQQQLTTASKNNYASVLKPISKYTVHKRRLFEGHEIPPFSLLTENVLVTKVTLFSPHFFWKHLHFGVSIFKYLQYNLQNTMRKNLEDFIEKNKRSFIKISDKNNNTGNNFRWLGLKSLLKSPILLWSWKIRRITPKMKMENYVSSGPLLMKFHCTFNTL